MSTQWLEPSVCSVWTSCLPAGSSFEPPAAALRCCMLGERSSRMSVVSARPPAASPSQPLANGRLTANTSAGDGRHAQQHDQPLPQPRVAARHALGRQQKHHGGPVDRLEAPLIDQVNDDRQRDQRQGRPSNQGCRKLIAAPWLRRGPPESGPAPAHNSRSRLTR